MTRASYDFERGGDPFTAGPMMEPRPSVLPRTYIDLWVAAIALASSIIVILGAQHV